MYAAEGGFIHQEFSDHPLCSLLGPLVRRRNGRGAGRMEFQAPINGRGDPKQVGTVGMGLCNSWLAYSGFYSCLAYC